ncbi:helix-turn-helix transcriptional regulator [Methanobrevibacter curvatus]|uniref:Methanogenesis regulatory protein FilR1 middle domain-containing protein n=1 Tax=Methanobrevibacter curvatus TaxID=49547 RepID=A0A162FF40_9EURY|nr:transcriptional regulator FilR1 domain-containing protein [Methanobrevibacter curvatus]KZX12155.1 hypothetical protein MBCUR_11640 [Methanobrevibacter curvatus]
MNVENILEQYNLVSNELKFITNSQLRLEAIKSFYIEDKMTMNEIYTTSGLSYSSTSTNIHQLERLGFLKSDKGIYSIKNLAKMKLEQLIKFSNSLNIINTFSDFLNEHKVDVIDGNYLNKIEDLSDSELVTSNLKDIYKPERTVKKYVETANSLKSIIPFIDCEFLKLINYLLENEISMKLLVPKSISNTFIKSLNRKEMKKGMDQGKFEIRTIKDEIKIFMTITEEILSLGLYKTDGTYDQNRIIISKDEKGINWGKKIFNSFYNQSDRIFLNI